MSSSLPLSLSHTHKQTQTADKKNPKKEVGAYMNYQMLLLDDDKILNDKKSIMSPSMLDRDRPTVKKNNKK